ncbi:MAG: glycoside hydrolase family 44 protein [Bacteroidota bacterium]
MPIFMPMWSAMRPVLGATVVLAIAGLACAKAPPGPATVPYDGSVGSGDDWNMSVDHVDLTIDPANLGRSISPLIYGYNSVRDPGKYGVASLRAGGNRFTAYNWENNASNAGNDFMFQNDGYLVRSSATPDLPGEAVRPMLERALQIGAAAILTIPNVDYLAADKLADGDVTLAPDYLTTRFKQNRSSKNAPLSLMPDATDAFVYQDEFVAWVADTFPDVPVLFSMDNEPDLWSSTHKEVHPDKVTYDELVRRNTEFGRAVKNVWPWIPVLGFASYGWQGFVNLQGAPDATKGDFIDYYLDQMKAGEDDSGARAVDYLDLHWYPEAQGRSTSGTLARIVFAGSDSGPDMVQARVQAPRSLWDPSYREQSWITTNVGGPIMLIPRMQQKIEAHYPGTKLAITEWNYGGGEDMSGAVATADVLGIFGREGVGAANIWPSGRETFNVAAVGIYRNYDGVGARFGDTAVAARTSSIFSSSVYAAVESTNQSRLVIVAINKRAQPTAATLRIVGDSSSELAGVWVLAGTTPAIQAGPILTTTTPGTFTYEMPALSVSVIVPGVDSTLPPVPRVDGGAGDGPSPAVDADDAAAPVTDAGVAPDAD